ncbi:MAG: hypothetical protein QXU18_13520 [Thermoplasmatales archaeon]
MWKIISLADPFGIAISSVNAYVTSPDLNMVSIIGLLNNTVWKSSRTGIMPEGIATSPYNVYVANDTSGTVSIIGLFNSSVWKTVNVGTWPAEIAVSRSNAYTTNSYSGTVSTIGPTNNTLRKTTAVGPQAEGIAVYQALEVKFEESGLPGGYIWNVTVGISEKSSSAQSISFFEPNGVYSFEVGVYHGYSVHPVFGFGTVDGTNQSVPVSFIHLQSTTKPTKPLSSNATLDFLILATAIIVATVAAVLLLPVGRRHIRVHRKRD